MDQTIDYEDELLEIVTHVMSKYKMSLEAYTVELTDEIIKYLVDKDVPSSLHRPLVIYAQQMGDELMRFTIGYAIRDAKDP